MPPPNDSVLALAFTLPPEKAIEYLKSKGYVISGDWWEVWKEAQARAFTVAQAMRLDILTDIREMTEKALTDGIPFQEFKKELEPRLRAKGWWGKITVVDPEGTARRVQLGSPWRLFTIYSTNLQTAYMAGRYKGMMDVVDRRPWWEYVAVMDARTRPEHAALHGKVFRYDDPFWNFFYPPNGWNCRCRVVSASPDELDRRGITPSSSAGLLSTEDRLVSARSGIIRPVTVFTDPGTGRRISPDVGWDFNPGRTAWPIGVSSEHADVVMTSLVYESLLSLAIDPLTSAGSCC